MLFLPDVVACVTCVLLVSAFLFCYSFPLAHRFCLPFLLLLCLFCVAFIVTITLSWRSIANLNALVFADLSLQFARDSHPLSLQQSVYGCSVVGRLVELSPPAFTIRIAAIDNVKLTVRLQ